MYEQIQAQNLAQGEALKASGMKQAAQSRALMLSVARFCALQHAKSHGTCTADDAVRYFTPAMKSELGNAAGSIFKGQEWIHNGYTKSHRPSAHARVIGVWRLK